MSRALRDSAGRTPALRATLHRRLLAEPFDPATLGRAELRERLAHMLREEAPLLATATVDLVLDELVDDVGGLGPLEPLLADPTVTEIMVNGPDRVFVEREGRVVAVACEIDAATILRVVERVIAPLGLRLDRSSPIVDARLADGSRLHAVLPPLAPDGPCVSIRRFGNRAVPLAAFGLEPETGARFDAMVRAGWNIVVSGATSSGKTTCCNALARAIDPSERIVTIEETAELRLDQPHVVRLEARPANAEGTGAVSVRDLVRSALRMRPDRIVVGEVRGGEALDMLQACNTGHDGSLSTVHANSPDDALARLETLVLCAGVPLPLPAVRHQLTSAIDAIVQVRRGRDGRRAIVDVSEVGLGRGARTHRLLTRVDGRLVVCAPPSRPSAADRGRPGSGMARVHTVIVAVLGVSIALLFARAARRYAVADRLRRDRRRRAAVRVPDWLAARIVRALDAAALDVPVERAVSTWVWSATVAGVAGTGLGGPQVGAGLALATAVSVPVVVAAMHERRAGQIAAAVPETLERVASELRSGGTVATAITAVATGDGPLAPDLARVGARVRIGASVGQALRAWSAERAVSGVDAAAGALALCASVGGRSADALEGLATSLRDRLAVGAEARALSSQARMSALVVGGAPLAYIAWSALTDPHALQVLTGTGFGRACLVVGLGLEALGGWWMRAIVRSGSRS